MAALVLVAACSSGNDRNRPTGPDEESAESDAGETRTADEQLPLVASPVGVYADTGVYFTTVDLEQFVVAVDLEERRELWRRPSHQHGRIPGVMFSPYIDVEAGAVVVTAYDDRDQAVELVSFDLESGRERWRRQSGWAESHPYRCVEDELLCLATDTGLEQYDPDGGAFAEVVEGGLERSIGQDGDLRLSADSSGNRVELGEIVRGGYEARWQHPLSELVPAEVASDYGPAGGWSGEVDRATGRVLFWLGALPPQGVYEDPDYKVSNEELQAYGEAGFLVGLVDADGSPMLGVTGVYSCRDMPFEVDVFWTCEGVKTVEADDYDDDGILDPQPVFSTMVRRSAQNPNGELTVELPAPVPYYGGGIQPTSDPDRFLLTPSSQDADPYVLDLTTGETSPLAANPDLVAQCLLPEELTGPVDEDPLTVEMRTFNGEIDEYRTVRGALGVCSLDGQQLDPGEIIDRGPLANWFGIAEDHENLFDDELAATTKGWVLWTKTDRVLRVKATRPS